MTSSPVNDNDSDGITNNLDDDDDNDGFLDTEDAFPYDPNEFRDTDGDGYGDSIDNDIDGDGYLNVTEDKTIQILSINIAFQSSTLNMCNIPIIFILGI